MENAYWRRVYEEALSERLKEYFHLVFDQSPFVTEKRTGIGKRKED